MKKTIISSVLIGLYFSACHYGTASHKPVISADTANIASGEVSFNQYCSGCHNFRQDGIGPQLGGLTTKVSEAWIRGFIKDPQKVVQSGDERAQQLVKKYKTIMPSFAALTNTDLDAIIAYLHTRPLPDQKIPKANGLSNPVPEAITSSGLVAELELVTQAPASSDSSKPPLARITKLDFQPDSRHSFVVDLRGRLYRLQQNKPELYMDMARLKPAFIDRPGLGTGFGSFAFHPLFARNGLLYTTHTEGPGSAKANFSYPDSIKVTLQWVLTEWRANDPGAAVFSGTGRELLRVNMVAGNHGVQEITFNPVAKPGQEDFGLLYIGIGDGGSVERGYPFLVHSPKQIWGTILRIDPAGRNSANRQYGIPSKNPFAGSPDKDVYGEIYAYGFRNPHRITWTRTGQMLACNIGHGNIESVNLIQKGHDYGWPVREGTFVLDTYGALNTVYPLPANDSPYQITYPIAQYDHDEGMAISGGYEYWGKAVPLLNGKYLFGDIYTGRLFYIDVADIKQGAQARVKEWKVAAGGSIKTLPELCGSKRVDLHFGRDSEGELYILTKADGKLYKIVGAK